MATISSGRRTNRVSALLHLSFASRLFPFLLSSSFLSLSLVQTLRHYPVRDLSSSHTRYRRLVRRSLAIMTSQGGEYAASRPVALMVACCTHRPILATTALTWHFIFRWRIESSETKERNKFTICTSHFWYDFTFKINFVDKVMGLSFIFLY